MNAISPTKLGLLLVLISVLSTNIDSAEMACSRCRDRSCVCKCLNRIASLDPTILPNFCRKRSSPDVVQGHPEQEPTQTESSTDLSTCKKIMNLIHLLTRPSNRDSRVPITDYSENMQLTDY